MEIEARSRSRRGATSIESRLEMPALTIEKPRTDCPERAERTLHSITI